MSDSVNRCAVWVCDGSDLAVSWLNASISSFVDKCGGEIPLFVLTDGMDASRISTAGVTVLAVPDLIKRFIPASDGKKGTYTPKRLSVLRLLLPFLEDLSGFSRIVYLDCDTIVVDKAFSSIFDVDLRGASFGMVPVNRPSKEESDDLSYCKKAVKRITGNANGSEIRHRISTGTYYDAGVIVMDCDAAAAEFSNDEWLASAISTVLESQLNRHAYSVMNVLCTVTPISPAYCCTGSTHSGLEDVYCIHDRGNAKYKGEKYPTVTVGDFKGTRPVFGGAVTAPSNQRRMLGNHGPVAVCYVTDGHDDQEMRSWSAASVRKFAGDIPIYTCTVDGAYSNPLPGEQVIDVGQAFHKAYGKDVSPVDRCHPGSRFPMLIFAKFVLPLVGELSGYERILVLDGDIEVVSSDFSKLLDVVLPDDADIGLCPYSEQDGVFTNDELANRCKNMWITGLTYHTAGIVMLRGGWHSYSYMSRLKKMFDEAKRNSYFLPEEYSANFFLKIHELDSRYHTVPVVPGAHRRGISGDKLKSAVCLHYGGPRKKIIRPYWKRRFELGVDTDPANLKVMP